MPVLEPGYLGVGLSAVGPVLLELLGRSGTAQLCLRSRSFIFYSRAVKVLVFTFF